MEKEQKDLLLSLPNVVGVGHGLKEAGGRLTGQEAIIVLVKKKLPPDQLSAQHLVPKAINGIITDVIEVGDMEIHEKESQPHEADLFKVNKSKLETVALDKVFSGGIQFFEDLLRNKAATIGTSTESDAQLNNRTEKLRPASPGMSVGNYRITAGTFGAVVYDRENGQAYILSNNHVLANSSNGRDGRARIGDLILQPGPADGGDTSNSGIAKLAKYVTLSSNLNVVDCALAKPLNDELIVPDIIGIGKINGITSPVLGMRVKKSGRTTGVTTGTVRAVDVTLNVNYGNGRTLRFENQIFTTKMSEPGDSGSLVVDYNNKAVGLLFAGSDKGTLLNPIQEVLDKLKVNF